MENMWDFGGGPGVRTLLPLQGTWVGSILNVNLLRYLGCAK